MAIRIRGYFVSRVMPDLALARTNLANFATNEIATVAVGPTRESVVQNPTKNERAAPVLNSYVAIQQHSSENCKNRYLNNFCNVSSNKKFNVS